MKRPTAKKLRVTKETLRTLSNAHLRGVIGGTDAATSEAEGNCIIEIVPVSDSCVDSADACLVELNTNVTIGVNTLRRS